MLSKYDVEYQTKEVQGKGFNKPTIEDIKEEMLNKWDDNLTTFFSKYAYIEEDALMITLEHMLRTQWFLKLNKYESRT